MSRRALTRACYVFAAATCLACGGGGGGNGPSGPTPATPPPDAGIGPAGGTLSVANDAARLVVPAGALTTTVGLRLQISGNGPLDPHAVAQSTYELTPAGTAFSVPATLVIRYAPDGRTSGTDEADLRLHLLAGNIWQSLGGTVDVGAHEATASISGAATFAVRWLGPRGGCSSRARVASSTSGWATGTSCRVTWPRPATRSPGKATAA